MDRDRVLGSAKEAKGKLKEAVGRAVGDAKLEPEGTADKVEGKVQNAVGGMTDAIRGKKARGLRACSAMKRRIMEGGVLAREP